MRALLSRAAEALRGGEAPVHRLRRVASSLYTGIQDLWGRNSQVNLSDISGSVRTMGKREWDLCGSEAGPQVTAGTLGLGWDLVPN